ncbi:MAG: MBL fold metallo-hydrolase [Dehalococcoidia bacterium]
MPAPMLKLGDLMIVPLSDGGVNPSPTEFFPSAPAEAWQQEQEFLNADGNLSLNFGCFLVQEGGQWNIVDTGIGGRGGQMPVGKLMGELDKAKVKPEQIGRVIITHLHGDHIGWNTIDKDGKPEIVFKNARHIVQRREWEYWAQPEVAQASPVIGLCAEPLKAAGLLDLIDGDRSITPSMSSLFTPGHTPGHQSVLLASGGEKAIITGDMAHSPVQLNHPDWSSAADADKQQSAETRTNLFDRIEQEGLRMCAGHYPYPSIGTIVRVEGKRRWQGI